MRTREDDNDIGRMMMSAQEDGYDKKICWVMKAHEDVYDMSQLGDEDAWESARHEENWW